MHVSKQSAKLQAKRELGASYDSGHTHVQNSASINENKISPKKGSCTLQTRKLCENKLMQTASGNNAIPTISGTHHEGRVVTIPEHCTG